MAAYLNSETAAARLFEQYGVEATFNDGDLELASNEVDGASPFIGVRYDASQERAFPRSIDPNGNDVTTSTVPDDILNAVVCIAYALKRGQTVGLNSEAVLDRSLAYSRPKVGVWIMRAVLALQRWQRVSGSAR